MIESMFKDVTVNFKPFVEAAEINTKTTSKLVEMQAAFVTDMLSAGLANTKAMTEMKDPKEAFEAQQGFARDLGQKYAEAAQQQMATLTEAKEEIQKLAQESLSSVQAAAEKAVEKATPAPAAAKATRTKRATTAKS